ASARADNDEHLAVGHAEVDPVEDEVVAEALAHALELDHGSPVRRRHALVSLWPDFHPLYAAIKRDVSEQVKAFTADARKDRARDRGTALIQPGNTRRNWGRPGVRARGGRPQLEPRRDIAAVGEQVEN